MPQFNQTVGSDGLNAYFSGAWRNTGTADYGSYGGGPARLGVMCFNEMNLKGKKILSVKFAAKTPASGGNNIKYVLVYDSNYNYINTWATGLDHLGTYRGMFSEKFYNNTLYSIPADFLADSIAAGVNTFVIYHENESSTGSTGYSSNYLKWSSVSIQVDWEEATTACTAPTNFSISPQVTETFSTMTWSGESGGTNNDIVGYDIQSRDSSDGKTWGAWSGITTTTAASLRVSSPQVGYYRQYQIRTQGSAGADFYSPWAICPLLHTRYEMPSAPTVFTVSPAIYSSGEVTLTWSGAEAGTNAIVKYVITYAKSSDNKTWGYYQAVSTINSSATSGSATTTIVNTSSGEYTKYSIYAVDANNKNSMIKESTSIQTIIPPTAPTFNFPPQNAITYNPTPYVVLTLGTSGLLQTLTATSYTASAADNLASGRKVVLKRSNALSSSGSQTIIVSTKDTLDAASPSASQTFSYQKPAYTDASLVAGATAIRAEHMNELRAMVNNARVYYGLPAKVWSETITKGVTKLAGWKAHVLELRAAMEDAAAVVNGWDTESTTNKVKLPAWIDIPVNKPTADVIKQLREAVTLL